MSFAGSRQCKCYKWAGLSTDWKRPVRDWVVVQRKQNLSSYNGPDWMAGHGRKAESRWSHVLCLTCGAHWRTQAGYVDRLLDLSEEHRRMCYGKLPQGKPADPALLQKLKTGIAIAGPEKRIRKSSPTGPSKSLLRKPARRKR